MNIHKKYGLTPIINACGKMTRLANARALPEVKEAASSSLHHFFDADELQDMASEKIADFSGAEAGFVTACTAAGITIAAAACMTGEDLSRVAQLPDTTGMKNEVIIQKGHCVNFGAPVTQMVRLAGARIVEIGDTNGTPAELLERAITPETAAVLFVVSHHTIRFGCIPLKDVVETAHSHSVPVIVDAAAQSFLVQKIVGTGADIVINSGHKYLSGTVSGMVSGRRKLIRAMRLQNKGIGRTMKVGKEGIFGLMAALEARNKTEPEDFYAQIAERVEEVCCALNPLDGVVVEKVDDPNGNPFCRARVRVDPQKSQLDAETVTQIAASGRPSLQLRAHHVDEGYFDVDVVELTSEEMEEMLAILKDIFTADEVTREKWRQGGPKDPRFSWLGESH